MAENTSNEPVAQIQEIIKNPNVDHFTKEKPGRRNEDKFDHNNSSFILADGSTDKSGNEYDGKTGGEIASNLIVKKALETDLNGEELVQYLNQQLTNLYKSLGIFENTETDSKNRFTSTLVAIRIVEDEVIITQVGDSGFRINGQDVHREDTEVDIINAKKRAEYIKSTGNVPGGRESIMPDLKNQFEYLNNDTHPLGYGDIDGKHTPSKFVKTLRIPISKVESMELFSDGYPLIPDEASVEAWEESYRKVQKEDPDRWKAYPATKAADDRTIAVIKF